MYSFSQVCIVRRFAGILSGRAYFFWEKITGSIGFECLPQVFPLPGCFGAGFVRMKKRVRVIYFRLQNHLLVFIRTKPKAGATTGRKSSKRAPEKEHRDYFFPKKNLTYLSR
ncbi:MAG: hypothetical protein D6714_17345 [Bacteroidetes bacterium]|nr:MAG: hypothetical protein D6714_17345 [Bacteroidota bacterium]